MAQEGLAIGLPKIVEALASVFRAEHRESLSLLLSKAKTVVRQTSYDNWNGGTCGFTLELHISARVYAQLGDVDAVERDLLNRIGQLTRTYPNENVECVVILPFSNDEHDDLPATAASSASFWQTGFFKLFLSHVSADKELVATLANDLRPYGISAFVAHDDIEPTKEWEAEIRLALATCDALTCVLTEGFPASRWTDQEVGFAIGRGLLVVPIGLEIDPYGFMARHQSYSGRGLGREEFARGLVAVLASHEKTRVAMAAGLVTAFEASPSFAVAKATSTNLSLATSWSPQLAERVRKAVRENEQISGAWGVRERVETLLGKLTSSS